MSAPALYVYSPPLMPFSLQCYYGSLGQEDLKENNAARSDFATIP